MVLVLDNGTTKEVDSHGHLIFPTRPNFDPDNEDTWESDRAWLLARVGRKIWTGKGKEVATIVEIRN